MASFAAILAIGKPVALDASALDRETRGFISMTTSRPVVRVDGELDVAAAGVDADRAQHVDADVAHPLVLAVGERHGGGHGHRVAGVHAHRVDVLDRADDDHVVAAVAHELELELLPAQHRLLDEHGVHRGVGQPVAGHAAEHRLVGGEPRAEAAHGEARPDDDGVADLGGGLQRLLDRARRPATAGRRRPTERTISLNSCRSSPRLIASTSAPMSCTPYFSSTPFSYSPIAMLSAVCPPRVASSASGRSLAITCSTNSGVSGST